MLEIFQDRVNAGMEATMNGEDACPCSIFQEVSHNGDLMNFLFNIWNGALMALAEHLPDASGGKITPSDIFGAGEAGEVVERLANETNYGEALKHVIVLAAAAGHAAALDELNGVGQSDPADELEAFLRSLMGDAEEVDEE